MSTLVPDHVLLGLLKAGVGHGYQLREVFRDPAHLGRVWDLSTSQLYAVLKRLDQQGWIAGEAIVSSSGPPRTEYRLTASGDAQFMAWLHDPQPSASVRSVRVEFMSRLYLARLLNLPTADLVTAQKRACAARRAALLGERASAAPGVELLAVEFVVAQLDAILNWIDRSEMMPHSPGEDSS